MWLFLAFIAVPLIEIALFIQVGGAIGLGWTLAIVLVTAFLGTMLVRSQGALVMNDIRNSINGLRDPTEPLAHGAMILFAGALLLTPGFFTDACGFALLLPPVRRRFFAFVRARVKVQHVGAAPGRNPGARPRRDPHAHGPGGDVIEGDFEEIEIRTPDPDRKPSGWTRRDH